MTRQAFLDRVRAAARAGRQYRTHADPLPTVRVGYAGGGDDLVAKFANEANAAGAVCQIVDSPQAAGQALAALLDRLAPSCVACWQHPLLEAVGVRPLLAARRIRTVDEAYGRDAGTEAWRRETLAAELGISSVSWAIAETGTLALSSAPGQERLVSLTPAVHVALVDASQVVADLFDLFDQLGEHFPPPELPTSLVLITGPSKTGDLELTLTTGVHGPGELYVFLIR